MASKAEVPDADVEYESDPDDSPLPVMRRREAASDESEASDGAGFDPSDDESKSQGGAEEYYDDDDELLDEEEEYEETGDKIVEEESRQVTEIKEEEDANIKEESKVGEKKENEPFAVPTTGAFYMHDDRFAENGRGGGRRRRGFGGGGRKIWNSKEEGAWVHDRFEEMNIHESRHDDGRRKGRGGYRGERGRGMRGGGPRRGRGGRGGPRTFYEENQNQNLASRSVRGGRGPSRRYEPVNRNNSQNPNENSKQIMQRNQERGSNSGNNTKQHNSYQNNQSLNPKPQQNVTYVPKKSNITISSSLNSASPPFYPSNNNNNNNDNNNGNNKGVIVSVNKGEESNNKNKGKPSGFVYGGAQVINAGNVVAPHGDQGFAGTPALLPVMQFSQQHPGVPALGMAVPGYVANSDGFGNSAWVIAGPTGGYPYVASYYNNNNNNDNNNNTRPSSSAPSRETSSVKSPDAIKSSQKLEVSNEEQGQRQNKPRRYSKMDFKQ